jgi:hypothetical protein
MRVSRAVQSPPGHPVPIAVKLPFAVFESLLPELSQKRGKGRGGQVAATIRQLFTDLTTFFGLPAPQRKLLDEDRVSLGINSHAQYFQWLVLQRATELERRAQAKRVEP